MSHLEQKREVSMDDKLNQILATMVTKDDLTALKTDLTKDFTYSINQLRTDRSDKDEADKKGALDCNFQTENQTLKKPLLICALLFCLFVEQVQYSKWFSRDSLLSSFCCRPSANRKYHRL
jgi:hypothetical protein